MTRTIATLTALFVGFGLLMLASGLLNTLLALRMGSEGFSLIEVGFVMSAYAVGFLSAPFVVPRWIHRIGHIRFFTALAALAAATTLIHALVVTPIAWLVLRAITGFALASLFMVLESWLNHRADSASRGRILSVYMIVNYLGFGGGQFLLKVAPPGGYVLFILSGLLFCLALIPVALTRVGEPERPDPHLPRLGQLWRKSPLGIAGAIAAGFIGSAFTSDGPIYARTMGLSTDKVATFMGLAILAGLFLQWPIGWLSDRIDRRRMIASVGLGIACAAGLLVAATLIDSRAIIIAAILYGGIAYTLYPLVVSHANDVVTPEQTVSMSAGVIIAFGTGAVFGPIVGSKLMAVLGPGGLFIMIGATGLLLSIFALLRSMQAPPVPEEDRGEFMPMAAVTPMVVELDPRALSEEEIVAAVVEERGPENGG